MKIEEILKGESKNVEFKVQRPKDSLKYMKSVVAFANGEGGKIIFGVEDKTREVIGIGKDVLFSEVDAITNAISDSCEPAIIPDVYLQTIDNKTIIIAEIAEGRQRPYYVKSLGMDQGVYIRVAGTSRPADAYMIKELLMEGNRRSFDQTICSGWTVTESQINELCLEMKNQSLKHANHKEDVKDVGLQQLLSWGILIKRNDRIYPTYAFYLLSGTGPIHTVIQCAVFKGVTKGIFVDHREYTGTLWEQIDQAYDFVLRNIHLGARIVGIYREDVYEIPADSIRELIVNAVVHRSYLDHNNIQVAIYDNRLEITSPGKLPMGQTIEKMKEGYSRIRNEAIASAFDYMNLIEHWGSGIPKILTEVKEAGLPEPEFIGGDVDLRINIYRKNDINMIRERKNIYNFLNGGDSGGNGGKFGGKNDCNKTNKKSDELKENILILIASDQRISTSKIAETLKVSKRTIERNISLLKAEGKLKRVGSARGGHWELD